MATSTKKSSHAAAATVIHSGPRKFKASDLPLPSATRAAIESLAHSFKKGGAYDSVRKQVWDKFAASDYEAQVTKAILEVAEKEVERNPLQLLTLDRRKAAALIDGALERSGVYQKAEDVIGQLIDLDAIEEQIREIRRAEIGEEAAEAERMRGSKTDEAYAADIAARQAERERLREEIRLKEAAIEEEKRRIAREEHKKEEREREQAEIKRQEERDERRKRREQERAARERLRDEERDRRHKERELWNKEREQRGQSGDKERDRDGPRDRDRERDRSRDRTRERTRDKDHGKGQPRDGSRARDRDTKAKPTVSDRTLSKEDNDRLEQEALANLLRESSRTDSAKPELEVDEALAPPPRKTAPASAIDPIRRETRKANDSSSKNERRESKTPADPKISNLRDEPKHPSRSASLAGDGGRDKDRDRGRDRDRDRDRERDRDRDRDGGREHRDKLRVRSRSRRSRSPKRDRRSRSRNRSRRDRSRSRLRRDRSRSSSRHRRDDRRDHSRAHSRSHTSRSHHRSHARSKSPPRSERTRSRPHRSHKSPSRTRRSRSRNSCRGVSDRYEPRERDKSAGTSAARTASAVREELEVRKMVEVRKREQEAKAYLAAQKDAKAKGLPIPGLDDRKPLGKSSCLPLYASHFLCLDPIQAVRKRLQD
ncbi:hypothetical protein E4U58_004723 [Claviceps cyperi]|nr:hypothetical protein E4U58_004723 [Claviceps cyperi]